MAEDQGVNGSIWNKEATKLLSLFGWKTIGDYDMDVQGEDGEKYGLDTILSFYTPIKNNPQSIILEAKRYNTESFSQAALQKWVDRLDKKLIELRNSEDFIEKFPELKECSLLDTGIIAIWFHNINDYRNFRPKFIEALENIVTSNRVRKAGLTKIFVIDNDIILKLCSLQVAISNYETDSKNKIEFYYPSILINDNPIARDETLTIEYIFSKVILAEAKGTTSENIVFYFGEVNTYSFRQLRTLLTMCSFMDKEKSIRIFIYQTDETEFRKIKPDIDEIFDDVNIKFQNMDNRIDLLPQIKDVVYE